MKYTGFYKISSIISSVVLLSFVLFPKIEIAYADALTSVADSMSNVTAAVVANHTFQIKLSAGGGGVGAGETLTITFPSGFASGLDSVAFGDVDVCHNVTSFATCYSGGTELTLAAAASTTTWGIGVAARTLTLTSDTGTLPASSYVTIEIGTNASTGGTGDTQIVNPAAGSSVIDIAGTNGDVGSTVITTIADSSVDVTATVDAADTLTFTVSDTAIGFGTLSYLAAKYATADATGSSSSTSAHTLTGASTGTYAMTVIGATLTSSGNTVTAITTAGGAASSAGSEQFGVNLVASGGSGTVDGDYDGATFYYGATSSLPDDVAACAATCSSTTTYTASYLANITSSTESGSYTATLTYVATGTF